MAIDAAEPKLRDRNLSLEERLFNCRREVQYIQKAETRDPRIRSATLYPDVIRKCTAAFDRWGVNYRLAGEPILIHHEIVTIQEKRGPSPYFYSLWQFSWVFVNVDRPEQQITVCSLGEGLDDRDKGVGKATTYASKYALLHALGIETGDDPDMMPYPGLTIPAGIQERVDAIHEFAQNYNDPAGEIAKILDDFSRSFNRPVQVLTQLSEKQLDWVIDKLNPQQPAKPKPANGRKKKKKAEPAAEEEEPKPAEPTKTVIEVVEGETFTEPVVEPEPAEPSEAQLQVLRARVQQLAKVLRAKHPKAENALAVKAILAWISSRDLKKEALMDDEVYASLLVEAGKKTEGNWSPYLLQKGTDS